MENTDQAAVDRIVAAARQAPEGEPTEDLKAAVRDAEPNDRALAAKALADEAPARDSLHAALKALGIEDEPGAE